MDKAKEYLPFGNSAAILASAVYFYRKNQELEETNRQLIEGIRDLNKKIITAEKRMNRTLKEVNERVVDVERIQKTINVNPPEFREHERQSPQVQEKKFRWAPDVKKEKYNFEDDPDVDDLTKALDSLL
jgi:hypothetical protein